MFLKSNASAVLNIASFQSKGFLAQTMSTLRVLGVPGHGQTAKAFREKSGCVRGKLRNKCEFVYIEPPFHLEPCALQGIPPLLSMHAPHPDVLSDGDQYSRYFEQFLFC